PRDAARPEREIATLLSARFVALGGEVRQVVGRDVAGDVVTVEARRLELPDPGICRADRGLERCQILVNQKIRADLAGDFGFAASGRYELALVRHVDPVNIRIAYRRARRSEVHLARAGLARHRHDLTAGR